MLVVGRSPIAVLYFFVPLVAGTFEFSMPGRAVVLGACRPFRPPNRATVVFHPSSRSSRFMVSSILIVPTASWSGSACHGSAGTSSSSPSPCVYRRPSDFSLHPFEWRSFPLAAAELPARHAPRRRRRAISSVAPVHASGGRHRPPDDRRPMLTEASARVLCELVHPDGPGDRPPNLGRVLRGGAPRRLRSWSANSPSRPSSPAGLRRHTCRLAEHGYEPAAVGPDAARPDLDRDGPDTSPRPCGAETVEVGGATDGVIRTSFLLLTASRSSSRAQPHVASRGLRPRGREGRDCVSSAVGLRNDDVIFGMIADSSDPRGHDLDSTA